MGKPKLYVADTGYTYKSNYKSFYTCKCIYKSSVIDPVFALEQHGIINLPCAFSLSVKKTSRCSGLPSTTPVWQVPQTPDSHATGINIPLTSST